MKPLGHSAIIVLICAACVFLAGCDWVDSAGTRNTPATGAESDIALVNLLDEQTSVLLNAARTEPGRTYRFEWADTPLEQGILPACEGQNGFAAEFTAGTLQQACSDETDCEFEFDPVSNDADESPVVFELDVPTLDASVGLTYELRSIDELGNVITNAYTFCLISINEAPTTNDDTYVVTEGSVLTVAAGPGSLLSNDSDDTDVRNSPLSILPVPVSGPSSATVFDLGTDGSFTYQSSLTDLTADEFDNFEYQLTDGLFVTSGNVRIRIVATNQAPQQLSQIPPLAATEGVDFSIDLSDRFADPEGGDITFELSPQTPLATGSGLTLTPAGVLSGIPDQADVGSYQLTVIVSDGGSSTEADLTLEIAAAPVIVTNSAPVFIEGSVSGQSVQAGFLITPIRPEFNDPDGDPLTYSMAGNRELPFGITIDPVSGVISGRAFEVGVFSGLRVRASDPAGASAESRRFTLTVTSAQ